MFHLDKMNTLLLPRPAAEVYIFQSYAWKPVGLQIACQNSKDAYYNVIFLS